MAELINHPAEMRKVQDEIRATVIDSGVTHVNELGPHQQAALPGSTNPFLGMCIISWMTSTLYYYLHQSSEPPITLFIGPIGSLGSTNVWTACQV